MNIVVIGSCADSSYLAKELNKRLQNSIIARVDMLKTIKQLILANMGVGTTENLGTYIGDVEAYDLTKATPEKKATILKLATTINTVTKNGDNNYPYGGVPSVSTFDALTKSIPNGTYSFIKVYSGAIDEKGVSSMVTDSSFLTNSIFVTVKSPQELLLPITVSKETLTKVKTGAFAFVECEKITDIFKSEVFQLLFELTDEKETKVEAVKKAVETTVAGQGLLAHIMQGHQPVMEVVANAA